MVEVAHRELNSGEETRVQGDGDPFQYQHPFAHAGFKPVEPTQELYGLACHSFGPDFVKVHDFPGTNRQVTPAADCCHWNPGSAVTFRRDRIQVRKSSFLHTIAT